ncbi:GSCFA domain-containing protein [Parabacteroides pacaensis]|uniref:GSCFA domain-containing protein n=1 Tax=Parabacteroides pacaensis TaxID=2086575 RepID=UPI000D0F867C|nr:GSCFA domain-containing protein [Parabacteroides pacaensis]
MELSTRIMIPKGDFSLSYSDKLLLLGSCFAENIGQKLLNYKFNVDSNPFGILYNPYSIASAIRILKSNKEYMAKDLFQYEGVFHSFDHHSRFSSTREADCLQLINSRLTSSRAKLPTTSTAIITLGTSFIYHLKETGKPVTNCHKLPEKYFIRRRYELAEIAKICDNIMQELLVLHPQIHVIFTVSPIRHWKDGAHANQLSKATLLLAIDKIQQNYPNHVTYFPAYEIMMDELRDYRFYADDMLHPSPLAIEYIWQHFCESYMNKETLQIMKEWEKIQKAINHRPFNPQSEIYHKFILQTLLKIERITRKFPFFDSENEIKALKSKLI